MEGSRQKSFMSQFCIYARIHLVYLQMSTQLESQALGLGERMPHRTGPRPGSLEAPNGGGGQNMQHSVRCKADGGMMITVQTVQRDSRRRER